MGKVQPAGGLVQKQELSPRSQSAGDSQALLLATGKALGMPVQKVAQIQLFQEFYGAFLPARYLFWQGDQHLVEYAFREELVPGVLHHHEAEFLPRFAVIAFSLIFQRAPAAFLQSTQAIEKTGFSGSVCPGDRRDFSDGKPQLSKIQDRLLRTGIGKDKVPQNHGPVALFQGRKFDLVRCFRCNGAKPHGGELFIRQCVLFRSAKLLHDYAVPQNYSPVDQVPEVGDPVFRRDNCLAPGPPEADHLPQIQRRRIVQIGRRFVQKDDL